MSLLLVCGCCDVVVAPAAAQGTRKDGAASKCSLNIQPVHTQNNYGRFERMMMMMIIVGSLLPIHSRDDNNRCCGYHLFWYILLHTAVCILLAESEGVAGGD